MEWQIFTYKKDSNKDLAFEAWVKRLANGVRAEQVQLIGDKDQVLLYFPSNYNDEFDEFGQLI